MRSHRSSLTLAVACSLAFVAVVLSGCGGTADQSQPSTTSAEPRVLVFTKTAGFRHDSIGDGITAIRELGAANGFAVDATEDSEQFRLPNLGRYRAIIFLSTTGDVLNETQQENLRAYMRAGGGFVGIHAAADTEYDWAWYGELVGARFLSHPVPQSGVRSIADSQHPSTAGLPNPWSRFDEWYNFQRDPAVVARILVTIDEKSYAGGQMGDRHAISWAREFDGGRSWYKAMGHTRESYADSFFRQHVLGGIRWAGNW